MYRLIRLGVRRYASSPTGMNSWLGRAVVVGTIVRWLYRRGRRTEVMTLDPRGSYVIDVAPAGRDKGNGAGGSRRT